MNRKPKKRYPMLSDMSPFAPIVQKEELTKDELLSKAKGRVQDTLLNIVRMMRFEKVGMDGGGNLYII